MAEYTSIKYVVCYGRIYRVSINYRRISLCHNFSRKCRKIMKFMLITHNTDEATRCSVQPSRRYITCIVFLRNCYTKFSCLIAEGDIWCTWGQCVRWWDNSDTTIHPSMDRNKAAVFLVQSHAAKVSLLITNVILECTLNGWRFVKHENSLLYISWFFTAIVHQIAVLIFCSWDQSHGRVVSVSDY
jgi:hypothetical protein